MPLLKGAKARTKQGFSENIRRKMHAGKPQKQALAIAYSEARQDSKHKAKGESKMAEAHHKKEHHKKEAHKEIHHHHKMLHDHHMKEAKHHEKMMHKHHNKKK